MKQYQIAPTLSVEGETLKDAIENNFSRIAWELNLGNVAGYQLHQVWCEYDPKKEAAVLHVISTGSDDRVGYDPINDPPAEKTLCIQADPEDCPERIDFELKEDAPFDPFDDTCLTIPDSCFGSMLGIIDEIGERHCKIKVDTPITTQITIHYPNMLLTYPLRYAEFCRKELTRRRPKTDNETTRLMERVSELYDKVLGTPNAQFERERIARYKTQSYFATVGKMTALAKIRAEKGMTQAQLADAAQMSVRQLQNYEKCPGSTLGSASRSVPDRLAAALGVDRSAIVGKDGFAILVRK